jgi:hypothetical protein
MWYANTAAGTAFEQIPYCGGLDVNLYAYRVAIFNS